MMIPLYKFMLTETVPIAFAKQGSVTVKYNFYAFMRCILVICDFLKLFSYESCVIYEIRIVVDGCTTIELSTE